jgi:hypothetical protein
LILHLLCFDLEDLGGILTIRVCLSAATVRAGLGPLDAISVLLCRIHVVMVRLLLRLDVREVRPFMVFIILKHFLIIVVIVLLVRPLVIGHGHA